MTDDDEREFLAFLRVSAPIQLIESFAPSPDRLLVDAFAPREQGHWQYLIWNTAFAWTPTYGTVSSEAASSGRAGWSYVSNRFCAPLIEYDRQKFTDLGPVDGRVYWAKHRPGDGTAAYDFAAFSKWYEKIVRWIRKNGRQQQAGAYEPYFLPDAWQQISRARQ